MENSRTPISPAERDILEQLEGYVAAAGDDDLVTRDSAVTYLVEQGYERADAHDRIEQLLLKGYLYEVEDELRIPSRS